MTADQPLRVVIADDQASVREGLVLLLGGLPGIDVVGAAADGEQALRAAAGGLTVFDPRVHATLLAATSPGAASPGSTPAPPGSAPAGRPPDPPDGLTQREVEILGLIAQGLTNGEIADRLFLSNHTIKTHINRIFAKTGSRDRVAAIAYAKRHAIG
jgi:DNA-binding NarL/FixJ family response regulator